MADGEERDRSAERDAGPIDRFFPYRFDRWVPPVLRPLGVAPGRDGVHLDDRRIVATFGRFRVEVPIENIAAAGTTGPYRWFRAIGPRGSLADHGLTFGTTTRGGTLIEFVEPIRRVIGPWDHPNLTVTVAEPESLAGLIERQRR